MNDKDLKLLNCYTGIDSEFFANDVSHRKKDTDTDMFTGYNVAVKNVKKCIFGEKKWKNMCTGSISKNIKSNNKCKQLYYRLFVAKNGCNNNANHKGNKGLKCEQLSKAAEGPITITECKRIPENAEKPVTRRKWYEINK